MRRFWISVVAYYAVDFVAIAATGRWVRSDGFKWVVLSFFCYTACTAVWLWSMGGDSAPDLANALSIYSVFSIVPSIVVALMVTGDKFTVRDWIGVAFGIVSVILLSGKHSRE
jgi:drug/metabolite transporter (DMT)-like permease